MKIAIIITVYERPELLDNMLKSLFCSWYPINYQANFILVNDGSRDPEVKKILQAWSNVWTQTFPDRFEILELSINRGVNKALFFGFERALEIGSDLLINLDSDIILSPVWISKILELWKRFPDHIISGFNTGSHPVFFTEKDYYLKHTIGGVNMAFSPEIYKEAIFPALTVREWDFQVNEYYKRPFIVTRPSILEHVGEISTLGHNKTDKSLDFNVKPY